MSRRRRRKKLPRSAWISLCAALAAAVLVWLQPALGDYGADWRSMLDALLGGRGVHTAAYPSEGTAEVHFIDVGQGSCILIKGSEKTALIDAGEADMGERVAGYLTDHGVVSLDYFFNTHPHSDHMGGCKRILETTPTANFLMTDLDREIVPTTTGYKKLITYLGERKDSIAAATAKAGDSYELGGGLRLTVVGPVEQYSDLNNASLVIRMDFGETSFLFTGDMEAKAQRGLLESGGIPPADVLSAPHHGSNTSIDTDFMRALRPQTAVVSCGRDNDYGHPHPETLELYADMGIDSYRTDKQGTVVAVTDGETITFTTEKDG